MDDKIVRHSLCDFVLMPQILNKIIYDNGASITGRGIDFQRNRIEVHIHKYCNEHKSNEGYVLLGDFSKYYDNVLHSVIKEIFAPFCNDYQKWLLEEIIDYFKVDVSYMSDIQFNNALENKFNSMDRVYFLLNNNHNGNLLTGEKMLEKSVDIGDQLSQLIGIYYPNRID